MARLQLNYPSVWSWRCEATIGNYIGLIEFNWRWRRPAKKLRITDIKGPVGNGRSFFQMQCCSTSSPSSAEEVELDTKVVEVEGSTKSGSCRGGDVSSLVRVHGWHVRRMVQTEEEMRKVARAQAEAFHEPVILFNDFFFEFFQVFG